MKELYIEQAAIVNPIANVVMADGKIGYVTGQKIWSNLNGKKPSFVPVGLVSGGVITPAASGSNNKVDISAFTYYDESQVKRSVAAQTDITITRASEGTHRINSIVVAAVAGTVSAIAGDDTAPGATAFTESRGAAGGPPWIPYTVYAIELGQVATSSDVAAPITTSEIRQNRGQHTEQYNFPVFEIYPIGTADNDAIIQFSVDLPQIHSSDAGVTKYRKKTTAITSTPQMVFCDFAGDFVQSGKSLSGDTETKYAGQIARGAPSVATSDASFSVNPSRNDTISNFIQAQLADKQEIVTIKYFPDGDNIETYRLEQGYISGTATNPAEGLASIEFTISPTTDGVSRIG